MVAEYKIPISVVIEISASYIATGGVAQLLIRDEIISSTVVEIN